MKKILIIVNLLIVLLPIFAKYEEGDICDDISWTDSEGLETSIYQQTEAGKAVLIFWGSNN